MRKTLSVAPGWHPGPTAWCCPGPPEPDPTGVLRTGSGPATHATTVAALRSDGLQACASAAGRPRHRDDTSSSSARRAPCDLMPVPTTGDATGVVDVDAPRAPKYSGTRAGHRRRGRGPVPDRRPLPARRGRRVPRLRAGVAAHRDVVVVLLGGRPRHGDRPALPRGTALTRRSLPFLTCRTSTRATGRTCTCAARTTTAARRLRGRPAVLRRRGGPLLARTRTSSRCAGGTPLLQDAQGPPHGLLPVAGPRLAPSSGARRLAARCPCERPRDVVSGAPSARRPPHPPPHLPPAPDGRRPRRGDPPVTTSSRSTSTSASTSPDCLTCCSPRTTWPSRDPQ